MTGPSVPVPRGEAEKARREAREAAALRENLRRRKLQGRLRSAADDQSTAEPQDPGTLKPGGAPHR